MAPGYVDSTPSQQLTDAPRFHEAVREEFVHGLWRTGSLLPQYDYPCLDLTAKVNRWVKRSSIYNCLRENKGVSFLLCTAVLTMRYDSASSDGLTMELVMCSSLYCALCIIICALSINLLCPFDLQIATHKKETAVASRKSSNQGLPWGVFHCKEQLYTNGQYVTIA